MAKSTFSERLNLIISEREIRQKDLCQQTGIGKSAMSQYLSGAFEPKQQNLYLLASALNVSEAWLMGYDVPREITSVKSSLESHEIPGSDKSVTDSTGFMEVAAPDNTMSNAHIPAGALVRISPVDPDDLSVAAEKIVCWSSTDNSTPQLHYMHFGNGTLIFTAADPAIPPQVFSFSDLNSGRLLIHGVATQVIINL